MHAQASGSPLEPAQAPVQLAIVGLGAIGGEVAQAVLNGGVPGVDLVAAVELRAETVETFRARGLRVFATAAELSGVPATLVLETAGQAALGELGASVLRSGQDLIAMSAGALLDSELLAELLETAAALGRRVWLPSGAIGGLDVLRAAAAGEIESISLTTTKPPQALAGAPYLREHGIDLAGIEVRTELFHGPAAQAVRAFPQNVNVAALLSLASGRPDLVTVSVVADPDAQGNRHEVRARGTFGSLYLRLDNAASAANPKTSAIAAQSVIGLLRQLGSALRFG